MVNLGLWCLGLAAVMCCSIFCKSDGAWVLGYLIFTLLAWVIV